VAALHIRHVGSTPMNRDLCQQLISLRRNHSAWLLLASRNAPLTLSCLKSLFDHGQPAVTLEDATEKLAEAFSLYANDTEFDLGTDDNQAAAARRELRQWISRDLIVERQGQLMATDPLQRAFAFLDSLQERNMTSTASRLATVQREIENLAAHLSQEQSDREAVLKRRIAMLETELKAVQRGEFKVLDEPQAREGIREIYQLASSLQADFRRVEDSYRDADRNLRQRILGEKHHRGEIVDDLLAGHEALLQTVEGQVFESFHQQLVRSVELAQMKQQLRSIIDNEHTEKALTRKQTIDLRQLVPRLVGESERVIQARARSEKDVRGFLNSGLADEQIRVGALLQEIFQVALEVDWQSQKVRRAPAPIPPVAVTAGNLPVPQRFTIKETTDETSQELDLTVHDADLATMDDEFWQAYQSLDRAQLFEDTLAQLKSADRPYSIAELAQALPPSHDLETLTYWLAREAGIEISNDTEAVDLFDETDGWTRFHTPRLQISLADIADLDAGGLE
jgi:hypothetical protein